MILSIPTTFGLFCTEPQIINADLGFQHFKLIINRGVTLNLKLCLRDSER